MNEPTPRHRKRGDLKSSTGSLQRSPPLGHISLWEFFDLVLLVPDPDMNSAGGRTNSGDSNMNVLLLHVLLKLCYDFSI